MYKMSADDDEWIQGGMEEDNEEDRTPAASVSCLPSAEIEGLWEKYVEGYGCWLTAASSTKLISRGGCWGS